MSFAPEKVIQTGQNSYVVSYGDDTQVFPEFYDRIFEDKQASLKEGRPVHKSIIYLKRTFPGNKSTVKDEPVYNVLGEDLHNFVARFPKAWADYKAQREHVPDGTNLLEWPPLPRAEAMDLKAMKIHTVEQLSELPDTALTWLGARDWRNKAKVWLANASGPAGVLKLQSENDTLKADVEMLRQQIKDLASMKMPETTEPAKRGPGRPKQTETQED